MFFSSIKSRSLLGIAVASSTTLIAWQSPVNAQFGNMTQLLQKTSDTMNQNLPMMMDGGVRWDTSYVGPGKVLNYKYTLVNQSAKYMDSNMFAQNVKTILTPDICNNPTTKIFPDNGVLLNFNYFDNANSLIASVKVAPSDCQKLARSN